jgi:hypothetical protein
VPASGGQIWRAIYVEYAVVEMASIMHTEDGAAASLRLEEGQIAEDDAIVYALADGKRGRDLLVDFDLVAAGGGELAEVSLPYRAPSRFGAEQLAVIEHCAREIGLKLSLQKVVGGREARGESCGPRRLARQAETVLAKEKRNRVREMPGIPWKQREHLRAVREVAKVTETELHAHHYA